MIKIKIFLKTTLSCRNLLKFQGRGLVEHFAELARNTNVKIIYPDKKSNDTNHWPYLRERQFILALIEAYVCLGRRQGTKCPENRQPMPNLVIFYGC